MLARVHVESRANPVSETRIADATHKLFSSIWNKTHVAFKFLAEISRFFFLIFLKF